MYQNRPRFFGGGFELRPNIFARIDRLGEAIERIESDLQSPRSDVSGICQAELPRAGMSGVQPRARVQLPVRRVTRRSASCVMRRDNYRNRFGG
jgi:hypothetical protein